MAACQSFENVAVEETSQPSQTRSPRGSHSCPAWRHGIGSLGIGISCRWRISIDVHDALDLMIASWAGKELALVIKLVIAVRTTPR
jgi:hypothetical protein